MDPEYQRRKKPRIPMSIRVKYAKPDGTVLEGMTDTIGAGGIYIESLSPLPQGTPVTIEFTLPGTKQSVRAQGEVVWTRGKFERRLFYPGMGIKFTKIDSNDEEELTSLITTLLKKRQEYGEM